MSSKNVINTYLFNCDLLNKYFVNSLFNLPKLKTVSLDLPLLDLLKCNENALINETASNLKLKAFLLLYFYFQTIPFIKCQKIINKNFKEEKIAKSAVSICFSNPAQLSSILFNFFLEKKFSFSSLLYKEKMFFTYFQFLILSKNLENFEKTSNDVFTEFNTKGLFLQIHCKVIKPKNALNLQLFFQNLPFFWING